VTHSWDDDTRPADPRPADVDGRQIAWCGFVGGAVLSVAANVAHAEPTTGARIAGAAWPSILLCAFWVLTRVRWRPGRLRAFDRYLGATAVSIVAAVMSYRHMASLLGRYGEDGFGAHLGPLAVDGLMVICGAALLSTACHHADETDSEADEPVVSGPHVHEDQPATAPAESTAGRADSPTPARPVAKRTSRTRTKRTSGTDISDLLDPIRRVLAEQGDRLGRDQLAAALRARGCTVGGARKQAAKDEYDRQARTGLEVAA
jgi:hypothetical protein